MYRVQYMRWQSAPHANAHSCFEFAYSMVYGVTRLIVVYYMYAIGLPAAASPRSRATVAVCTD